MPQSLGQIYLHLIFSTKNRDPFLIAPIRPRLHAYIAGILKERDSPALIVGSAEDHVHILCNLSRSITVAKLVEHAKTASSKWLKEQGPEFRGFQWQAGYGAFSVSASRLEAVRKYIEGQEEHHKRVSFQDEFRKFLKEYAAEFDERYVWD